MSMIHIRYKSALLAIGALCAGALAAPAWGASFDCAKASTKVEHLICNSPELSKLDDEMAAKFKSAQHGRADRAELMRGQMQWLSQRNACPDVACIKDAYEKKISDLSGTQKGLERHHPVSASTEGATSNAVGPQNTTSEQNVVRQIMLGHRFFMKPNPSPSRSADAFCKRFIEDFRTMEEIVFLQPLIESDSYADKKWDAYKARCPDSDLFEGFSCDPQTQEGVGRLPKAKQHVEKMRSCKLFRCTQKFSLYKATGKGYNGPAFEAFYCEHMRGPVNWGYTDEVSNGGYQFFNPQHCDSSSWVTTTDPYSYSFNYALNNHNGIILYRGGYFVFNLFEPDVAQRIPMKDYFLEIWGSLDPKSHVPSGQIPTMTPICLFSTIPDSTRK